MVGPHRAVTTAEVMVHFPGELAGLLDPWQSQANWAPSWVLWRLAVLCELCVSPQGVVLSYDPKAKI